MNTPITISNHSDEIPIFGGPMRTLHPGNKVMCGDREYIVQRDCSWKRADGHRQTEEKEKKWRKQRAK
jgi:hypothetical protein